MTIKEVYEKFKHLDKFLNDRDFLANQMKQINTELLADLWQAIKEHCEQAKAEPISLKVGEMPNRPIMMPEYITALERDKDRLAAENADIKALVSFWQKTANERTAEIGRLEAENQQRERRLESQAAEIAKLKAENTVFGVANQSQADLIKKLEDCLMTLQNCAGTASEIDLIDKALSEEKPQQ